MPRPLTKSGKPKGQLEYFLPSFDTNVLNNCMPLGYSFEKEDQNAEPCVNTKCDLNSCSNTGAFQRLQCFHTFHTACLNENYECPICLPYLDATIRNLANSFNSSLLEPTKSKSSRTDEHQPEEAREGNMNARPPQYYKSTEWKNEVRQIIQSYPLIMQPRIERKSDNVTSRVQSQRTHCSQPGHTRSASGNITCPQHQSQAQRS